MRNVIAICWGMFVAYNYIILYFIYIYIIFYYISCRPVIAKVYYFKQFLCRPNHSVLPCKYLADEFLSSHYLCCCLCCYLCFCSGCCLQRWCCSSWLFLVDFELFYPQKVVIEATYRFFWTWFRVKLTVTRVTTTQLKFSLNNNMSKELILFRGFNL